MDYSLTTDFDTELLDWDEEHEEAAFGSQLPSEEKESETSMQGGQQHGVSTDTTTANEVKTEQSPQATQSKTSDIAEVTMDALNMPLSNPPQNYPTPNQKNTQSANHQQLLNGFVTALAGSSTRSSSSTAAPEAQTAQQSNQETGKNTNNATLKSIPFSSSYGGGMQQGDTTTTNPNQQKLSQGSVPKQFPPIQDSDTNQCNNLPSLPIEPIYPPNYFLPGMMAWDPSQQSASTITTHPGMTVTANSGNTLNPAEKSQPTESMKPIVTPNVTQATLLAFQQQQQNQLVGQNNNCAWNPIQQQQLQFAVQSLQNGSAAASTQQQPPMPLMQPASMTTAQNIHTTLPSATPGINANNLNAPTQTGYNPSWPTGNNIKTQTDQSNNMINSNQQVQPPSSSTVPHVQMQLNASFSPPPPPQQQLPSSGTENETSATSKPTKAAKRPRTGTKRRKNAKADTATTANNSTTTPPFFLFDAPCELRSNFLKAQQAHNIKTTPDNNSYHYGLSTVKGFHPSLNAQAHPTFPASAFGVGAAAAGGVPTMPNGEQVKLLDGRHKNKGRKGNERNEREQQRAQKITELIDKLRTSMKEGGWKDEMKSKYQTLSTCATYVKYLINLTKEKEAAVEKAKSDLKIRGQKLEEDKVIQDSRSDPESVTSSLTASSASGTNNGVTISSSLGSDDNKKQKSSQSSGDNSEESDGASPQKRKETTNDNREKVSADGGSSSNLESTSRSGQDSRHEVKNITVQRMSSSISTMSNSNGSDHKVGTNKGNKAIQVVTEGIDALKPNANEADQRSEPSSISSTAAVMSGVGSHERDHVHTDVIIKGTRKRKHQENTSIDEGFELDYEEVFASSNIPQLISTQTGRIVTCNDFFHKATGLNEQDVQQITIFSLVKSDNLSTLFQLVATSLREAGKLNNDSDQSSPSPQTSNADATKDHTTVTVPCISFLRGFKSLSEESDNKKPLFMTILFVTNDNPSKSYIHCLFSDTMGNDSKIGIITKGLLDRMNSTNECLLFEDKKKPG